MDLYSKRIKCNNMKKIILSILTLLLVVVGFSQSVNYYSDAIEIDIYKNGAWTMKDLNYANFVITMENNTVSINDIASSVFTIQSKGVSDNTKNYKSYDYKCIDEKGKKCIMSIIKKYQDDFSYIMFSYNNVCFKYYLKNQEIDNF